MNAAFLLASEQSRSSRSMKSYPGLHIAGLNSKGNPRIKTDLRRRGQLPLNMPSQQSSEHFFSFYMLCEVLCILNSGL